MVKMIEKLVMWTVLITILGFSIYSHNQSSKKYDVLIVCYNQIADEIEKVHPYHKIRRMHMITK